jgi:hypothetical protein
MSRYRLLFVLAAALCLGAVTAPAQTEINYGFMAGVNRSSIHGDTKQIFLGPDFEYFETLTADLEEAKAGMALGLFISVDLETRVSFRTELLFKEMGGKGKFSGLSNLTGLIGTPITGTVSMKTTYIEIPALMIFPLPGLSQPALRGVFGVSACFTTSSDMRVDTILNGIGYSDPLSYDDRVQSIVYQGIVGLEYQSFWGDHPFHFGVRYEAGLTDYDKDLGGDPNEHFRHRNILTTFGIPF